MLGLQGLAFSSKEYECVACSATFTGLASLLVHQATHAGSLPKPEPTPPGSNLLQASSTPSSEDGASSSSNIPSTPMYICDCGDEFKDFFVMIAHKQSHVSEVQSPQVLLNKEFTSVKDVSSTDWNPPAAQADQALGEDSVAGPSVHEVSSFKNNAESVDQEEPAAAGTGSLTEDHSPVSTEAEAEEMPEETEGNEKDEPEPKSKSLMKILASAYGKHLVPPRTEDDNKVMVSLKEEPALVVIAPQTIQGPSTVTDMSTMQLKRLLGKPSTKTKAPSISRLLESSTKKIVSLTKIFSPVVLLETRHKFMDPSRNNAYGKYQCARCRRVFQDIDSLTEHHFLHKKERIKCCRCCKQLIIGRVPLPDNHVCPQIRAKTTSSSFSIKSIATRRLRPIQMNILKKVYFCPICQNNFTQRYNLKKHKCNGPVASPASADKGNVCQSIGVGTRSIKVEDTSDPEYEEKLLNVSLSSASSIKEQHQNASAFAESFLQEQDSQWTIPLDIERKMVSTYSGKKRCSRVRFYEKNVVGRYPCNKCHQTFGLTSNLSRHRKLCCGSPKHLGGEHISESVPVKANNVNIYPCNVCGRNFNRKDNMMVHRKKCELRRTMIPQFSSEINPSVPPSNAPQDVPQEDDGGNWSIMSLPSVLPRRVTCECGIGFTSPKLLLEHLQKHAQESYTCPTCGVTVNSWSDYEIHLQLHMHPQHHRHLNPLLIQLKTNMTSQQLTANSLLEKAPQTQKDFKNRRQMFACSRCGSTFARRCSLRRHLTWSQCTGF
ncbi:uncharacterized protein [Eucyclogobius newberryi]|uniref:uncharacterized protein n=1 Tax=Eucyclogobius newberryi TaxID=166745 RepID=UPI003B5BDE01